MKFRRTDLLLLASLLILFALYSPDVYSKDMVRVYKGEVGSFKEVRTRANPYPMHGRGEVLAQEEIHRLILLVGLIPSESVVDVYSIKTLSKTEKKTARSGVVKCLTNAKVEATLNAILRGFQTRLDVPDEVNQQFHKELFQCLEPSRPEELTWAVEFREETFLGEWAREREY
jgi:hypothetical protein